MKIKLPKFVKEILKEMKSSGHEAYLVGGCVRDLLLGVEPFDWDIATDALPDDIMKIFAESFCENDFGTVTLKPDAGVPDGHKVEITPYRTEFGYSDKRHPDKVTFGVSLEEDLSRRDFTVNAIAYNGSELIDPFEGQADIKKKIIRTVGLAEDRFNEDALRLMRAVRFATTLGFKIEDATLAAVKKLAKNIVGISVERIRDELNKIVSSVKKPSAGFVLLHDTGLLKLILPEFDKGHGVAQCKHHIYTVFDHNIYSLDYAAKYKYSLAVRWAALLHDIGKPKVKKGRGESATFYNHDIVGAKMARDIMIGLKFPKDFGKKVVLLVRYHMFFYDVGVVTEASIRRLVKKVGQENIQELLKVRIAERKGSGVPKDRPYRLRHLEFMIEKVARDPISVKMLKLDGDYMIEKMGFKPGPRMGWILNVLLEDVLDDPKKNLKKYLVGRVKALDKLNDKELIELAEKAKEVAGDEEEKNVGKIKEKFFVK